MDTASRNPRMAKPLEMAKGNKSPKVETAGKAGKAGKVGNIEPIRNIHKKSTFLANWLDEAENLKEQEARSGGI